MGTATYQPTVGEHVLESCRNAIEQAQRRRGNVLFKHNDVTMVATPRGDAEKMVRLWQWRINAIPTTHEQTLARREMEQRRADESARAGRLAMALPRVLEMKHEGALIRWIDELVKCGDWIGMPVDWADLRLQLEGAGWVQGDACDMGAGWYNTRERMARWIVGEVMNHFSRDMPPHPITGKFCGQYFELPQG